MKRVPESFELSQEDIAEAIEFYLNNHEDYRDDQIDFDYKVTFKTETRRVPPPGGHRGGMSDDMEMTIVSAVAVKED